MEKRKSWVDEELAFVRNKKKKYKKGACLPSPETRGQDGPGEPPPAHATSARIKRRRGCNESIRKHWKQEDLPVEIDSEGT